MEKKLKSVIRDVPDFPKKGIIFKDLTPIFKDKKIFKSLIDYFYKRYKNKKPDAIVAVESRGFIIGAALAYKLGVPFVPARKPGKLPRETYKVTYSLEYGEDALEIHKDALKQDDKVLIIDDLLATGGTANAVASLVEMANAKVMEIAFIVELDFLNGREKLKGRKVFSIVHY
ncbi:MAG: adenine phosphoribosyltransferase [Candidatus Goldbacteria bacterium]|nr:adenine phosphoribosyltransferase [Candidatus Goldiibacteriota bacterium]